jgi:hypothetical protein
MSFLCSVHNETVSFMATSLKYLNDNYALKFQALRGEGVHSIVGIVILGNYLRVSVAFDRSQFNVSLMIIVHFKL